MNNLAKRSLALILALVLCLSLLPVTVVPVSAASYIYNWGTRGEVATSLSAYAQAFYTGNNTYDALSALAGGTSKDNAPTSILYKALQSLMVNAHSHETSYDETKDLFMYTDCQNGGGKISTFYSGTEVGPEWISGGKVWNREHTWPDSKGDASGNGENDIIMLRPANASLNSSRGNAAYGESAGYYDPNSVSGGKYNLHGDVARIMLYVYVRWGNTGSMWGSSGVIESLDVLVDWMEEDPVDTWEMGRNDSVQSITGTRNVFVDYPELAFQLFGEEVPADMTTPSGEGASAEQPNAPAEKPVVYVTEINTLSFADKAQRTSFSTTQQVWEQNGITFTNDKASSTNAVADYAKPVRLYANSKVTVEHPGMTKIVFDCNSPSYATALKNAIGTPANGKVSVSSDKVTVEFTEKTDSFEIAKLTAQVRIDSITVTAEVAVTCDHTNTKTVGVQPATCVAEGYTGDLVCADCEDVIAAGNKIPVIDHNYVDGACSACGAKDLSAVETTTATITFDVADGKRTTYDTTQQVWVENGITVTNLKAKSSSNVADAVAPVKFYAHSSLNVTFPGMLQIVFNCNNETYASALKDSISVGVVELDKTVVTVTFTEAISGFDIADLSAKVFMDSITVTAVACDHAETTVEGKVDVTCTTDGHTGATVCLACGATVNEGEVITAPGHNFVDGTCSACGEAEPTEPEVPVVPSEPTVATSIASGTAYKLGLFSTSKNATYYFTGAMSSYYGATETAYEAGIDVFVEETDGGYYLYFIDAGSTKQYINLVASGTHKNFTFNTTETSVYTWDAEKNALCTTVGDEVCYIGTYGSYVTMSVLQTSKLKDTDYIARLYTMGGSSDPDAPVCEHTNTNVVDAADATCTAKGHTGKTVCDDCGATVNAGSVIDYLPHAYENGACAACGVKAPETAVTTKQAYKFGMIQYNVSPTKLYYLTGAMDSYYMATTSVADEAVDVYVEETESGYYLYTYINTVKHYINMVISNGHVNGAFEATASTVYTFDAEKNTLVATVNDGLYRFGTRNDKEFTTVGPVLVEYNGFYCQLYKFVEGNPNEPTCQHTNTKVEGAADATCTAEGHTGATVCVDCGVTVNAGEVIGKLDHNYVEGVCSACGETDPNYGSDEPKDPAVLATFTFKNGTNSTWTDGSAMSESTATYTDSGYTLSFTDYSKVYAGGWDPHNNGFIKFGTSSVVGTLTFTVPDDVTSVELHLAMYKDKTSKYSINGGDAVALTKSANNGEYDVVTVDTTENKTITLSTVSGGVRMVMRSVIYKGAATTCEEHSFVEGVCSVCGHKLGDIDGNEALTHEDAVYLLLYTMFPENYPLNGAYVNVDGDQDVDQDDAVYLLLNVLFGDDFYPLQIIAVLPDNEEEAEG